MVKEVPFIHFLSRALVALYSVEKNHVRSFGPGLYEEHFCEMILNLDQWLRRRCRVKTFLIYSSSGLFVRWSGTICAMLVEGIMRNNSVKLF